MLVWSVWGGEAPERGGTSISGFRPDAASPAAGAAGVWERPVCPVRTRDTGRCGGGGGGRVQQEAGNQDESDIWFDRAAEVWTKAVRLYPGGYLEIENWLKTTGRSKIDII